MATQRKIRLGVAGLGRAFSLMLPTLVADERITLVAGADPRAEARARFEKDFGGRGFATVEAMCETADIDAVYISTPHQFHRANVEAAARARRHVLVEKPMSLSLADCAAMIETAEQAGIAMVVGHSHSFDRPIARTREIIAGGVIGRLRMINALQFTDFLYRPRRPEELATDAGGGVIFNQAPHQVDNVRLIGGGRVKSVRASAGIWDASRPTEGAYSAFLTFEDGAFATLTYSGYAHFDTDEFSDWIAESGLRKDPARYGAARAALGGLSGEAELAFKSAQNYGGPRYAPPSPEADGGTRWHQHFGLLVASCEHGDLRPQPHGIVIYGDRERRFEELEPPRVPRSEVIDELYDAIFAGKTPLHGGAWALATMEVCFAILQSSREAREISLSHQCGLAAEYDTAASTGDHSPS
jgi:phthalate 4,5-cis-dihydrodiol dehydrogenase